MAAFGVNSSRAVSWRGRFDPKYHLRYLWGIGEDMMQKQKATAEKALADLLTHSSLPLP